MAEVNGYKMIKCIGEGSFGKVFLTKKKNDPKIYATKQLELIKTDTPQLKKYLQNEIKIMKELNDNDNIIHLYDLFVTNNHYYFVMEFCNGGTLADILGDYKLKFGKPFSQEIIQYYMRQIVRGLKYIHSKKIIHRDMKLANILVNFDNDEDKNNLNLLNSKIKIIDFGLATKNKGKTLVGSPLYMDPIILKKYDKAGGYEKLVTYDEKADIWSLGAICYEMLTGETLFNVNTLQQLLEKVEQGDYTLPIYMDLSKEMISFIISMLEYDGDKRLSAEELYNHSFLVKDIKDFSKPDYGKVSYKIQNGLLQINFKKNQSVLKIFNETKIKPNKNPKINLNKSPSSGNIQITDIKKIYVENNKNGKLSLKSNNHMEALASPKANRKRRILRFENKDNEQNEMKNIKQSLVFFEEQEKGKNEINTEKSESINNDWETYMIGLLNEYMAAKKYFEEYNLKSQEEDANKKFLQIKNIKEQYKLGYTIYLSKLPEPVSPEYIYGHSALERNNKFKFLIEKYKRDQNKLIFKIKSYQKNKVLQKINGDYETDKKKLNDLDSMIKNLEKNYNNIWVPVPGYTQKMQKVQVEKVSYDNCEFKLKIQIKRMDNINQNINFVISLKLTENKNLIKDISLTNQNNFSDECIWSMDNNDWKNIDNNVENFMFRVENQKKSLGKPFKAKINIGHVKRGKGISFNIKIPINNNTFANILFNIFPIIPKGKKYLANENKVYLFIQKIYPPFAGNSSLTANKPQLP